MSTVQLTYHPSADRGRADFGWLKSAHSFSFGQWYDPRWMGFGDLRVINDDYIAGGAGFPTHPHRDMEILTYVVEGAIAHKDSTGEAGVTRPGEIQRMTAGSGIRHSEMNPSPTETTRLLQIWVEPARPGLTPGYEQATIPAAADGLTIVASSQGDGAVHVNQDFRLLAGNWQGATSAILNLPGRRIWIQMITGTVTVAGKQLHEGDGLGITHAETIELATQTGAHFLVFDLRP